MFTRNIITATVAIIVLVIVIGWSINYFLFTDEDEYESGIPGVEYGPETIEEVVMRVRMTEPHLLADDWYWTARREFARWSAIQRREEREFRRENGLASKA